MASTEGTKAAVTVQQFPYGAGSEHFVRVHSHTHPVAPDSAPPPVAVIVHGGFWKNKYNVDNAALDKLPGDFLARGFVAVEVEYRRRDHQGGGWPGSNQDVADALTALPDIFNKASVVVDLGKVAVFGHSAGATLALWAGHNTSVLVPALVVAIAPISDLEAGHDQKLSDEGDAVLLYMKGTPADLKDAYAAASPIKLLPVKTNTLIVAGTADTDVPATHIAPYAEAAKQSKGDHLVTYLPMEGADHWALVDVAGSYWAAMHEEVSRLLNA